MFVGKFFVHVHSFLAILDAQHFDRKDLHLYLFLVLDVGRDFRY
jgi:hypothetical protein